MPLRPSQVETLRAVGKMTERFARASTGYVAMQCGISEAAAHRRCARLEARRLLASTFAERRVWFSLTQLGREALEES